MKKIVTTFLIILGFYYTSTAQTTSNTEFGVNIGLNMATVNSGYYTNSAYRIGFNAGLSGEYYLSNHWGIKVKAIYDQKGWNNGFISTSNGDYVTNFQMDYITVPVMADWHFGSTNNWYLNFGPYAGFLLSAKETAGGSDLKPITSSTDFGLAAGIGVRFPMSDNAKFFIELDGQDGVNDVFKNNSGSTVITMRSSINIGITFR
jgi:opacity protein-like surface antigen